MEGQGTSSTGSDETYQSQSSAYDEFHVRSGSARTAAKDGYISDFKKNFVIRQPSKNVIVEMKRRTTMIAHLHIDFLCGPDRTEEILESVPMSSVKGYTSREFFLKLP